MDYENSFSFRTSSMTFVDIETVQHTDPAQRGNQVFIDNETQFISQICDCLSLEETEHESRIIARQLLLNGRQELIHHHDSIAPIHFQKQMDKKGNSKLLKILKSYFQYQWQWSRFDWFKRFIADQRSADDDRHYQLILVRTAEYGQKYLKECPEYSIVLQLVFLINDDINMDETKFYQIWNSFAIEGCTNALKKWRKYIVSLPMEKRVESADSPLFLSLREYFREPVLSLFEQSNIPTRTRNILEVALDCLANHGWVAGLSDPQIKALMPPKNYEVLIGNVKEYLTQQGLPLPVEIISPQPILNDDYQSTNNEPIVAYIPELPLQIVDNYKIEDMIRRCLERKYKQHILDVKCDTHLGIGTVYLQNCDEKDHLVKTIESIILYSEEQDDIIIKFVSHLELISYVVIKSMNDKDLPSSSQVAQRFIEFYQLSSSIVCEKLSIQFPNIFKIVSNSLDELKQILSKKTFPIRDLNATVYLQAHCSFLEELPRHTNINQLYCAIKDQMSNENIPQESIYIQFNEATTNAVVLTCSIVRRWALADSINLNGKRIFKKQNLSYRLCLRPIPKDLSIAHIKSHKIFENSVNQVLVHGDHLMVELTDKRVYEKCVNLGALRIDDQSIHVDIYTSIDSEEKEINAENWYQREMFEHAPDMKSFISPKHPIFCWKWNPQAFLEQYEHCTMNQRDNSTDEHDAKKKENCRKRLLLRMTVMLNTIGIVWKGSYRVGNREIKLKEDLLKTVLYDHRSKLQRGVTMSLFEATQLPYPSTLIRLINEDCLSFYQRLVTQKCRPVFLNMIAGNSAGENYCQGTVHQETPLFHRSNYFRSLDTDLDDEILTGSHRFYCNSNCELEILSARQRLYPIEEFGAIYTAGLTVFRQAEETGFIFMDEPLSNVCAIAMAAYRDPTIKNNRLTEKFSIGMRKKIENMFAIAYHHKHDCLIFCALGYNEAEQILKHIVKIFRSVAEQYAGFFKSIYFAIADDQEAGSRLNTHQNYHSLKQLLDETELKAIKHRMNDTMIGPWRILKMPNPQQVMLSDIRISHLVPCYSGGTCREIEDARHCREYLHPPLCPSAGSGKMCTCLDDEDHMLWFIHRPKCPYGSGCQLVRTDFEHANEFDHPQYSAAQPTKLIPCCESIHCLRQEDTDHMMKYSHPCPYAELCRQKTSEPYLTHETYVVGPCSNGKSCRILDDPLHRSKYRHVDMPDLLKPCRHQQQCYDKSYAHRIKYSHGEYVELSPQETSSDRPSQSVFSENKQLEHKQRTPCRYGLECRSISDTDHRLQYSHFDQEHHRSRESNKRQKIPCKYGTQCRDRGNPAHRSRYLHPDD